MSSSPPIRAFQWDLARQVERLDFLLRWLPRYAEWGFQELYLHLEDAVAYPSLPAVARSDAYTRAQFTRLVRAATAVGIKVVPIVNLLGHTQYLIKVPGLRDLNELRDADGRPRARGQICPLHPRTLEIAGKLLSDMAPFCTAGKVHVGLDESFHLGKCPRCRAEVARIGLAGHFASHVGRLHELTRSLGLRMGLWADMLALLPAAIPRLSRNVIAYDWYYYPFKRRPRVELRNFAEVDLAAPLRARGIEYWGCPMNGAFRHEPLPVFGDRMANIVSWWRRCRQTGAGGFLITAWEPNRLAAELPIAVDAAAACLWLNPGVDDPAEMLARGFQRVFGRSGRQAARTILAADVRPFAGYHRWQINDRWDVCSARENLRTFVSDAHRLQRAQVRASIATTPALAASLAFRRYLAERDVFVRRAVRAVRQMRRGDRSALAHLEPEAAAFAAALRAGRRAARLMWARSRDPAVRGPNEAMLDRDADRLRALQRWLRRVSRDPAIVHRATPVGGRWQLQFTLHHFAPALQQLVVEQRRPDGSWRAAHRLFTIEFRAEAARPRTNLQREVAAPVDDPRAPLRIAVRGAGPIAIGNIELTDGVTRLRPRGWPRSRRLILGRPAVRRGFPVLDFERNAAAVVLRF